MRVNKLRAVRECEKIDRRENKEIGITEKKVQKIILRLFEKKDFPSKTPERMRFLFLFFIQIYFFP